MRVLSIAVLCLLSSIVTFSKARPGLQLKGELKIDDAEDLQNCRT